MSNEHSITGYKQLFIKALDFLIDDGLKIIDEDEYSIKFGNSIVTISIVFERYYQSVWLEISFVRSKFNVRGYDIGWILSVYEGGGKKDKYLTSLDNKIEYSLGLINFLRDYKEEIFNEEFCKKMKDKYDKIILDSLDEEERWEV